MAIQFLVRPFTKIIILSACCQQLY